MQQLCALDYTCAPPRTTPRALSCFKINLVPGGRLAPGHVEVWRELQQSNPELTSPFFAPEFTQAVAAVRQDVQVALIRRGAEVVGIFPYQRHPGARGGPIGGIVSDYQGLICDPEFTCEPQELLKACRLVAWDFDRLLASQHFFAPFHKLCEPSARIDLAQGYGAYQTERRAAGTRQLKKCEYTMRRMERELGPLRFVRHSAEPKHLAQVLAWKSQQYRQTGWKDLFGTRWGLALVERIHRLQQPHFAGMLSLLYAGRRLVAGHLGMRSDTVWHYWFPAYDREFAKYSPGLVLLLNMAQSAEELGLRSIDIGTGITLYKRRLMNASVSVAEGSVERPAGLTLLRLARRKLSTLVKALGR